MPCLLALCRYETNKLVRIHSFRLGSLKWSLNGVILMFICIMMLWNRKYQEFDQVVSSVTTKVKGVAPARLPGIGDVVWDVADYSGQTQGKNSFFVVTNLIVTKNQKQGRCAEAPVRDRLCHSDADCKSGFWDEHSHGVQTGSCVKADVMKKTCEVSAWCPVEAKLAPPRPALLSAAENFTVLIKNNIRFPAFGFIRRNILPGMDGTYLRRCRRDSDPLCPIFRLGDVVRDAGEKFSDIAVEGGVIGIQIMWDCNLDRLTHHCSPRYSFRRLDEKESNRTLYPGLSFRFAKYETVNGVEQRTLYKAFGIRFDVMVFGQAGRFSFIQLLIYIGSTLSYYALTTFLIDWLIETSCYSAEVGQNYSERKVEAVPDGQECILCVSFVDEDGIRLVKSSRKKSLQNVRPKCVRPRQEGAGQLKALLCLLQPDSGKDQGALPAPAPQPDPPAWCRCGRCRTASSAPQEELCCRRSGGVCITMSAPFERLVLRRSLLAALLLCRDPLRPPGDEDKNCVLRRCAYDQYISWRIGVLPDTALPVVPSCCVWRVREAFPSPDRTYTRFRPAPTLSPEPRPNTES